MKRSQSIMIWFLPLIVIGGWFYPLLGYLVVAMMAFFLPLSYFAGRYWCRHLCPRGAFLDIVMPKLSLNRPLPKVFARTWFRPVVFVLFIGFLVFRIIRSGGNPIIIASIFVGVCLATTIIAVILGVLTKSRGWCAVCPMGFLQEKIGGLRAKNAPAENKGK